MRFRSYSPSTTMQVLIIGTFVVIVYILVFSEQGYLNQRHYYDDIEALKENVARLQAQNDRLQKEIADLRSNPVKIEQLAREQDRYIYPGEQPLRVVDDSDTIR